MSSDHRDLVSGRARPARRIGLLCLGFAATASLALLPVLPSAAADAPPPADTTTETVVETDSSAPEAEESAPDESAPAESAPDDSAPTETTPSEEGAVDEDTAEEGSESTPDESLPDNESAEDETALDETAEDITDDVALASRTNGCDVKDFGRSGGDHCIPEPRIDVDLVSVCPAVVDVSVSRLAEGVEYRFFVGETEYFPAIDNGTAMFTVNPAESGTEVTVTYGKRGEASEHIRFKDYDCPWIETWVGACTTVDGTAVVGIDVGGLWDRRDYVIEITGADGTWTFEVDDSEGWWEYLDLAPGDYTVTVFSESRKGPDIGPVSASFTVAPCPQNVVITLQPVCAVGATGSLGASLSNLVVGREYHVLVENAAGAVITDVTFVADATTYTVPPAALAAGTYTVTVTDVASGDGGGEMSVATTEEPRTPLSWTATGTIAACPPAVPTTPAVLAHTGQDGSLGAAGLILLPIGLALLGAAKITARRRAGRDAVMTD